MDENLKKKQMFAYYGCTVAYLDEKFLKKVLYCG
jgi:hypothetical protein